VVVDIPLLAETDGSYRALLDQILVVDCDASTRRQRVMLRDGVSAEQVDAMMAAQAGDAARLALADDVIVNQGSLEELADRVTALDRKYRMVHRA
jgi:dephospho-CoA kinase